MNLCHTAIVSKRKGSSGGDFVSESEDELTFLLSTKQFGYRLMRRDENTIVVRVLGKEQRFIVISLLPFDQARKFMSILVRNEVTGEYIMFSKGADSEMLKRTTSNMFDFELELPLEICSC